MNSWRYELIMAIVLFIAVWAELALVFHISFFLSLLITFFFMAVVFWIKLIGRTRLAEFIIGVFLLTVGIIPFFFSAGPGSYIDGFVNGVTACIGSLVLYMLVISKFRRSELFARNKSVLD